MQRRSSLDLFSTAEDSNSDDDMRTLVKEGIRRRITAIHQI